MEKTRIKDLKKGDLFYVPYAILESSLLVRDHYDRSKKLYAYHYYHDLQRVGFLCGNTIVYC